MKITQRMHKLPKALRILREKAQILASQGVDIARLDVRAVGKWPEPKVIRTLTRAARRPVNQQPPPRGTLALRKAVASYYLARFGVQLDPHSEILPFADIRAGIHHFTSLVMAPGCVAFIPDPGCPTYRTAILVVRGEPYNLPLRAENDFLPNLSQLPQDSLARARLLWLNYPHNPTGAMATLDFLAQVVAFARAHDIVLAYDNAQSIGVEPDTCMPSILQVAGARDVAVEFNTLPITHTLAGWHMGIMVANEDIIAQLAHWQDLVGVTVPSPVQEAAVAALNLPSDHLKASIETLLARRKVVTRALERMRLSYTPYANIPYVWAEIPPNDTSLEFSLALLENTGIAVAPGRVFGPQGEGYVRISLTQSPEYLEELMESWERWMIHRAMGMPG